MAKNISLHPRGLLVQIERQKVTYRAWVPLADAARLSTLSPQPSTFREALARAEALRDRFLKIHGALGSTYPRPLPPRTRAYSNTGHLGISETTHWVHNRHPLACFSVSAPPNFRRRIYYGEHRSRATALQMAIALRRSLMEAACP